MSADLHHRARPSPEDERAALLTTLLSTVLVLGAVASAPSLVAAFVAGAWSIAVVGVAALALLAYLRFSRSLGHAQRSLGFLVLVDALGTWFLFEAGWVSHVYLLAVPVVAALLLGRRAAFIAIVVDAVTLLVAGIGFGVGPYFTSSGGSADSPGVHAPALGWYVVVVNFVFVATALSVACSALFSRFTRSMAEQQSITRALVEQRMNLHRTNDSLVGEIQERRRVEDELRRITRAVDQAQGVVLITSTSGRVVYRNAAAAELERRLGFAEPVQRLDRLTAALGADDILAAANARTGWEGEVVVPIDGTPFQYEANLTMVLGADGGVQNELLTLRDLTVERDLEERAQRAERLHALGTLARGVAHDFNNVIAAILATTEWARANPSDHTADAAFATITAACERAADIVREVMVLSTHAQPHRDPIELGALMESTLPLLQALLPANVELHASATGPAVVSATPAEITRVLTNLVKNARDAIVPDPGTLTIDLETGDGMARILVTDTGRGIPRDDLPHIFDPFFTTKEVDEGTGLGLAGVHAIATSLGGSVEVRTEPGQGTTFAVIVPLTDPTQPEPAPPTAESGGAAIRVDRPAGVPHGGPSGTILVVDDEPALVTVFSRALRRQGYDVVTAADAYRALDVFELDPLAVALLITDLTMPQMTGAELINDCRALRPDLPVILMSGFADERPADLDGHAADAADADADAEDPEQRPPEPTPLLFLQKPFGIDDLLAAVGSVLSPPREDEVRTGEL